MRNAPRFGKFSPSTVEARVACLNKLEPTFKGEAPTKIGAPGISAEEEISLRTTTPRALTEDAKLKDHLLRHPEHCFKLLQCSLKEAKTNERAGNKGAVEGNVAVPKSQLGLSGNGGVFVQQLRKYRPS